MSETRLRVIAHCLQREIPSKLTAIDPLCRDLVSFLVQHGLGTMCFPVELAARECLNNARLHGNEGNARKRIRVELRVGRVWARLQIADEGPGYPWRKQRGQLPPGESATSGRGLSICRLYAHRLAFNRSGNRITLWFGKRKKDPQDG